MCFISWFLWVVFETENIVNNEINKKRYNNQRQPMECVQTATGVYWILNDEFLFNV